MVGLTDQPNNPPGTFLEMMRSNQVPFAWWVRQICWLIFPPKELFSKNQDFQWEQDSFHNFPPWKKVSIVSPPIIGYHRTGRRELRTSAMHRWITRHTWAQHSTMSGLNFANSNIVPFQKFQSAKNGYWNQLGISFALVFRQIFGPVISAAQVRAPQKLTIVENLGGCLGFWLITWASWLSSHAHILKSDTTGRVMPSHPN